MEEESNMGKLVDMTGIELEQCVIDNDEIDTVEVREMPGPSVWERGEPLDLTTPEGVIEVPEDEEFIKEYIEGNLDSQPDNLEEDIFISSIPEPEVMPTCLDYRSWIIKNYGLSEYEADNCISTKYRELYSVYEQEYKLELNKWWFKRNSKFVRQFKPIEN
jgi:hypothetical protein